MEEKEPAANHIIYLVEAANHSEATNRKSRRLLESAERSEGPNSFPRSNIDRGKIVKFS